LKSTSTSVISPETWLPTVTVEIALSVPVAEIATRMSPRSIVAVRYWPGDGGDHAGEVAIARLVTRSVHAGCGVGDRSAGYGPAQRTAPCAVDRRR